MNPTIFERVQDRYRIADKALERMKGAETLEGQEDEWFTFLRAWKGIYTLLEQAVKGDAKATMWFGQRNSFRRNDPLLQYLYQARNDDEHGLTRTTVRNEGGLVIGLPLVPGQPVAIGTLKADFGPDGWFYSDDSIHRNLAPPKYMPPSIWLTTVKDRDQKNGNVYDPPTEHLGAVFHQGLEPIAVGEAGLAYVKGLIEEGRRL